MQTQRLLALVTASGKGWCELFILLGNCGTTPCSLTPLPLGLVYAPGSLGEARLSFGNTQAASEGPELSECSSSVTGGGRSRRWLSLPLSFLGSGPGPPLK